MKVVWTSFKHILKELLRRYLTVDKPWIQYYRPASKQGAKQWVEAGRSALKRQNSSQLAGKVIATVFLEFKKKIAAAFFKKKVKLRQSLRAYKISISSYLLLTNTVFSLLGIPLIVSANLFKQFFQHSYTTLKSAQLHDLCRVMTLVDKWS